MIDYYHVPFSSGGGCLTFGGGYGVVMALQPKAGFLPEAGRGRPKLLIVGMRTGRTKPGNRFQGHFQGQARQLISQAFGRAILLSRIGGRHGSPDTESQQRFCVLFLGVKSTVKFCLINNSI